MSGRSEKWCYWYWCQVTIFQRFRTWFGHRQLVIIQMEASRCLLILLSFFDILQRDSTFSQPICWDTLRYSEVLSIFPTISSQGRISSRTWGIPAPKAQRSHFFLIFFCAPNRQSIPRVDQRFSNSLDVTLDAPALKLRPALAGQSERHHRVAHDEDVGKEFDNQHFGDIFSNRVPVETWIQCSNPPYPPFMTRRSWWLSPLVLYWPTGLQTCPKLQRWPWDTMGYNEILIQSAAMKHNKDVAV